MKYEVILQAHNELNTNGEPNRILAIVVLSDGRNEQIAADANSLHTIYELIAQFFQVWVLFPALGPQ